MGGGRWPRLKGVCKGGVEGVLEGSERPETGCLGELDFKSRAL